MSEKKANGEIIVPTLNIEKTIDPLCTELRELNHEAEAINIFNPFNALKLRRLSTQKERLQSKYEKEIADCYDCLREPVSGPGSTMAFVQAWSTAKGISAILKLQNIWHELGAVLDRKYAYMFAILAIYVSILSVLLTLIFGIFG